MKPVTYLEQFRYLEVNLMTRVFPIVSCCCSFHVFNLENKENITPDDPFSDAMIEIGWLVQKSHCALPRNCCVWMRGQERRDIWQNSQVQVTRACSDYVKQLYEITTIREVFIIEFLTSYRIYPCKILQNFLNTNIK